jgi:hypothetical protein
MLQSRGSTALGSEVRFGVPKPDLGGQRTIRTYAVLCALTPLIPIPFVDDIARAYFRRRLVRGLASLRGLVLPEAGVRTLADTPGRGCLIGCLVAPPLYAVKKLFRKIFYFLEWKRAVDTASETYHFGSLVDHAFERRWPAPAGPVEATRLRAAVDSVLARRGTSPIDKAVREAFEQSKSGVFRAAAAMKRALGGLTRRPAVEQVELAVEPVERDEAHIADVAGALRQAMDKVPPGYLEALCDELAEELGRQT